MNKKYIPQFNRSQILVTGLLSLLFLLIGFGTSHLIENGRISHQNQMLRSIGKLSMNEAELIATAKLSKTPIYWAGPEVGARYSLTTDSSGSAIVRYLPTEASLTAAVNTSRMVATYVASDAYAKSVAVSTKSGTSSFINADKSLVFYKTSNTNDVFLSFPKKNVQIEVFDPSAGQALSLAVLVGQIRVIG